MIAKTIRMQGVLVLILVILFSILVSCSESGEPNQIDELEQSDHEIIFGNRSNDNIAHIAWEAESASPNIQYKQWQQVTTARNSALFRSKTSSHRPGSMVAASAGQYLTAHHVVSAILNSGAELSDYVLRLPRGWRFDNANPGNYADSRRAGNPHKNRPCNNLPVRSPKKIRNKSDSFVENISEACVVHASLMFSTTRRSPRSRAGLMR